MGTLFIIATPIGNLEDVTLRMLSTFRQLDVLLCEDTRVTAKLLARYELAIPLESYREEVHRQKIAKIIDWLRDGKKIGLVSDAGTPGVSDPGLWLVRDILAEIPDANIIPIPGASAAVAALSISGFMGDAFTFLGFAPHKKGRSSFMKDALNREETVILYESTHRIDKALNEIMTLAPERRLVVCRELTKLHETTYRGMAAEVMAALSKTSSKGEFVIVVQGKNL